MLLLSNSDDDDDGSRTSARSGDNTETSADQARDVDNPDDIDVPRADDPDGLGDDERFDRLAQECFDADPSSCDDLYRESELGSDYEEYGSTCGGRTDEGQNGGCTALYPDPTYDDLRHECADGDNRACDDLYTDTPINSVDEHFGSVCGGRSDNELAGSCESELD